MFLTYFSALIVKRVHYLKRDILACVFMVLLPCALILIGLALIGIQSPSSNPPVQIEPSLFVQPIPLIYSFNSSVSASDAASVAGNLSPSFALDFYNTNNLTT